MTCQMFDQQAIFTFCLITIIFHYVTGLKTFFRKTLNIARVPTWHLTFTFEILKIVADATLCRAHNGNSIHRSGSASKQCVN